MGKLGSQPGQFNQSSTTLGNDQSSASSFQHFSHPHPLQLSQHTIIGSLCSGCKLEASGMIYSCTICNYFLHPKCSQIPQQITHPFDQQNHVLSLLPKPVYPEGLFSCDACGQQGDGFSYHCQVCGIDLHILCASSPMTFMHQNHQHQLQLTFSPPYPGKIFSCDICGTNGSDNWLYRCDMCQFDVHLTCVNKQQSAHVPTTSFTQQFFMMKSPQPINPHLLPQNSMPNNFMSNVNLQPQLFSQHSMPNNFMSNAQPAAYNSFTPGGFAQAQPQVLGTPFAATTPAPNYGIPTNNFMNAGAYGPMIPSGNAQGNGLMNQLVGGVANGVASGASQAVAGALIQGLMGAGGGGGVGGTDTGSAVDAGYGGGVDAGYGGGMDGGYGGDANNVSSY